MSVPHYPLFIDGEWVDSPERYEIRSPATGELVATVAKGGTEHIDQAVAAAKAAHASGVWRDKAPEERADLLNAVAARLAARTDELAVLQTRENGATIRVPASCTSGFPSVSCSTSPSWPRAMSSRSPVPRSGRCPLRASCAASRSAWSPPSCRGTSRCW